MHLWNLNDPGDEDIKWLEAMNDVVIMLSPFFATSTSHHKSPSGKACPRDE